MNYTKQKISLLVLSLTIIFSAVWFFQTGAIKSLEHIGSKAKPKGFWKAYDYLQGLKVNQHTKLISSLDEVKAIKDVYQLSKKKGGSIALNWQNLGPDNVGGRARSILIDKSNPNTIYIGSVSGGLWKSETSGSSWVQVTEFNQSYVVSCMAQDKDGNIYIGTGEGFYDAYGTGTGGFIGKGVFFKASGSSTYTQLSSTVPTGNSRTADWAYVNNMACDPVSGRVYAATNKGLWYSDNKGQSWSNPLSPLKPFTQDVEIASNQMVAAVVNNVVYVAEGGSAVFEDRSTGIPTTGIVRTELAIAPSDPNYMYVCIAKSDHTLDGVYRTTDKGKSWSNLVIGGTEFKPLGAQGGYDNEIVVSPANKEKIYVGGIDMWTWSPGKTWTQLSLWDDEKTSQTWVHADHHKYVFHPTNPTIMYLATDGGIFKTSDGGNTFIPLNKNFVSTQFYSMAFTLTGQVLGGTQDNGTLYISGTGNSKKAATEIRGGDGGYCYASMLNPNAFFASYIYGDVLRSSDKGATLLGEATMSSGTDHSKFYSERLLDDDLELDFEASFVSPIDMWESISDYATTDSVNYKATKNYAAGDTLIVRSKTANYAFRYITNTAIASGQTIKVQDIVQSKFFLGVENAVWMTREALNFTGTPEWNKLATVSGIVQTMAHSKDGNYLYVGTRLGKIYRIKNLTTAIDSATSEEGNATCAVKTDLIAEYTDRAVTSIAVDPQDPAHVIVTLGNYGNASYIYRTTEALDDTVHFVSIQGNLPQMPVYSSLILNHHADTVLIGTEYGIYSCTDVNASSVVWTSESTGSMDPVAVYMLKQQTMVIPGMTNLGVIYAATHGRGFFKSDLFIDNNTMSVAHASVLKQELKIYPNPAKDKVYLSFTAQDNQNAQVSLYDMHGRLVLSTLLEGIKKGVQTKQVDCSALKAGTYFIRVSQGSAKHSSKLLITD